jgi:hypothetical protein
MGASRWDVRQCKHRSALCRGQSEHPAPYAPGIAQCLLRLARFDCLLNLRLDRVEENVRFTSGSHPSRYPGGLVG